MTKIQSLLKEIDELDQNDLELILEKILKKVNQEKRVKSILNQYKGIGKGIWKMDAQEYINQERNQDRA